MFQQIVGYFFFLKEFVVKNKKNKNKLRNEWMNEWWMKMNKKIEEEE